MEQGRRVGRSLGFEMGTNELLPREVLWITEDDMGITLTMVVEPLLARLDAALSHGAGS